MKNLLSKGWWAGVGVIVAVAFQPTYDYLKSLKKPTTKLEEELNILKNIDTTLNVFDGATTSLPNQADFAVREFAIGDNAKVVIPTDASTLNIKAAKVVIGEKASIQYIPKGGDPVNKASNGTHASRKCSDGGNGINGVDGKDGRNGASINIRTIDLYIDKGVNFALNGGNGGNGAHGGNGGNGGRASRGDGCGGGRGGNGGTSGDGGNGGNAGQLTIEYVNSYNKSDGKPISMIEVQSYLTLGANGGSAGKPGKVGQGGSGGSGRGAAWPVSGQPGGSRGNPGTPGKIGNSGKSVSSVKIVHVTE